MKYLKLFESVEPLDVEADITEFNEKYPEAYLIKRYHDLSENGTEWLYQVFNRLIEENPTMTDDYQIFKLSKAFNSDILLLRAVNAQHAYVRASLYLDTPQIVIHRIVKGNNNTWTLNTTSENLIKNEIEVLKSKIDSYNNII